MKRLTTDEPQGNLKNALNLFFAKDGDAWVRGGGPAPAYEDITLNEYIMNIVKRFALSPQLFDDIDGEEVAEIMCEWLYDGSSSMEGLIATLYTAGWAFAELRARLKDYEDTGLMPGEIKICTYTAQQITEIQNEAYDLGVQSVLHERFGLTWADAEELQKEIAKVKAATTWIKAEERLPSKEEVAEHYAQYNEYPQYIVMIFGGKLPTILSYDGYIFYDDNTKEPYSISHWMPRPAPPEGRETNE